jgi:hypothetical protein
VHRQHKDRDARLRGEDPPRRLDTVQIGKLEVHDDDVGLAFRRGGDGLDGGRDGRDAVQIRQGGQDSS